MDAYAIAEPQRNAWPMPHNAPLTMSTANWVVAPALRLSSSSSAGSVSGWSAIAVRSVKTRRRSSSEPRMRTRSESAC